MPTLKNEHLAGLSTTTAWGDITFSAEGLVDVSQDAADALVMVPGFTLVDSAAPVVTPDTPPPIPAPKSKARRAEG